MANELDVINVEGIKRTGVIMHGFEIMDIVGLIGRLTKRYQATLLANIEETLGSDHKDYQYIRKLVLDSTNNFSRAIVKSLFGDIEA